MTKKAYSQGSIVHVVKRGGRGLPIVKDTADCYRFLKLVYFLNDKNHPTPWEWSVDKIDDGLHFSRPDSWSGDREPYVEILSYCLMDNHFHLVLKELVEDGISDFMRSICGSMTLHFNSKYGSKGSIFQGPPKIRVVDSDEYLRMLYVYVNVKNPFERLPGGLEQVIDNFNSSWTKAAEYPFSSLHNFTHHNGSPLVSQYLFQDYFADIADFKQFAQEQMENYKVFRETVGADLE